MNVLRAALPGNNAKTDTDVDHFSLYSDQDNILIKEFIRDGASIPVNNGSPPFQVTHNLGYIPFHLVYAKDPGTGQWQLVPNFQSAFTVPNFAALCDTTKLYISNFYTRTDFKWFIFYDNMVGSSGISIAESANVIKVPRAGFNALTEKDPNKLLFHSDLSTLKIIKEGNVNVTSTGAGNYSFNHGSPVTNTTTNYMVYCKFPDGTTAFISSGSVSAKNSTTQFVGNLLMTPTQFQFQLGDAGVYKFKYFIFETPLAGSYVWNTPRTQSGIAVAKAGYNVLTDSHPDHMQYDSRFNTLKYAISDNHSINNSGNNQDKTVEFTVPNTWGGTCAFAIYVNAVFAGGGASQYAFVPHISNTLTRIKEASGYMDNSNLYLKLRVKDPGAFNITADFYYKIFKNKLNL